MAITHVGTGALIGRDTAGTVDAPWPAGYTGVADDIAFLMVWSNQTNTFSIPSGWTNVPLSTDQTGLSGTLFWKRLTGTTAAPTVGIASGTVLSGTNGLFARVWVFRGAATSDPPYEEILAPAGVNSTTVTTSIVTSTVDNAACIALICGEVLATSWSSGMPPSGWSNVGPLDNDTAGGDGFSDAIMTMSAVPVEFAQQSMVKDASGFTRVWSIVLHPAGAPTTKQIPTRVADRGTAENTTGAASTAVDLAAGGSIAVGNYLIARVAVDNSGTDGAAPGLTITDPRSNTWTILGPGLRDPGVANAGITAYLAFAKVANAYTNGDDVTFNWAVGNPPAKTIVVEEWSGIHPTIPLVRGAATLGAGLNLLPGLAARTPLAAGQMIYTVAGVEFDATDTYTEDSDTLEGTWTSLTRLSVGTGASGCYVVGAYKVTSGISPQTWVATIGPTSRDWAAVGTTFYPAWVAPDGGPIVYYGANLVDAVYLGATPVDAVSLG